MMTPDEFFRITEPYVKDNPANAFSQQNTGKSFDVAGYLERYGINFKIKQHSAGTMFCLGTCLFNPEHGKDAAIIQMSSGKLIYKCFHDSCQNITWEDAQKSISGDEPLQADVFDYDKLMECINAADDVGVLATEVARNVQESGLSQTEKRNLLKAIAKKTGGTIQTLCNDTQDAEGNNKVGSKIDHLQTAKNVVAKLGQDDLIYDSSLGLFRRWDGQAWVEVDDRSIKAAIVEQLGDKTAGLTKNIIDSITDLIRTEVFRDNIPWDEDTGVIPVENGELSWNGSQWILTPHVREHYRTTLIPVKYDPEARAPRFEQFLAEVFQNNPDAIEKSILICEMIGYTLTTSCEFEKFIMLIGVGSNGKSVLFYVLVRLVGPGQIAAVQPDQMDNRFQRAHLCGKLANVVTEVKEGGEIADAALKSITSGELTTAEHKFKKPFEFQPFATCWFGTNHLPHTKDFSEALFRRALIVEFDRVFQEHEQDKKLKQKLACELPGILNLALSAFAGVIQRGHFTIPASCVRAKDEWRIEADQIRQFVIERCTLECGASVATGTLYSAYKSWAEDAGIRQILTKNKFSSRVQRLGGKRGRTSGVRFLEGIRLGDSP